jgi:hypothetical protein
MMEGWNEANTIEDKPGGGSMSEDEADDLWAWMQEQQAKNPVPLSSRELEQQQRNSSTGAASVP